MIKVKCKKMVGVYHPIWTKVKLIKMNKVKMSNKIKKKGKLIYKVKTRTRIVVMTKRFLKNPLKNTILVVNQEGSPSLFVKGLPLIMLLVILKGEFILVTKWLTLLATIVSFL